jgi:hypothetical protein
MTQQRVDEVLGNQRQKFALETEYLYFSCNLAPRRYSKR